MDNGQNKKPTPQANKSGRPRAAQSRKAKVLVFTLSLILFLGLLEGGLRAAGYMIMKQRSKIAPEHQDAQNVVLCVGDSFTFGGFVKPEESYPAYLQNMLNAERPADKTLFVNKGVCEYNSRQVLKALPGWINQYRPKAVILLVGSANRFNSWGYNWHREFAGASPIKDLVGQLKIYKMLRILALALKGKLVLFKINLSDYVFSEETDNLRAGYDVTSMFIQSKNYDHSFDHITELSPNDSFDNIWYYRNTGDDKSAIALAQKLYAQDPGSDKILSALISLHTKKGDLKEVRRLLDIAEKDHPTSRLVRMQQAHYWFNRFNKHYVGGQFPEAMEAAWRAIEVDPDEYQNYYILAKSYDVQSRFDANDVVARLEQILATHPDLNTNPMFLNSLALFQDKTGPEKRTDELLRSDLDKIVRLCQARKVKLIIQDYPIHYPMANRALKDTATNRKLVFVENRKTFERLLVTTPTKELFFNDDHGTPRTHRIMAGNIFDAAFLP